jgi:purine nucleosidase
MPRKVIVTADPGQEAAVALLMTLARADVFDVLGIVSTAGNIDLTATTDNCLKIVELSGRTDIRVYRGCEHPMLRPLVTAEHVHGPTGMDGYDLPAPHIAVDPLHGVDFIVRTLRAAADGEITILSQSPLTNLAVALIRAPEIAPKIAEIVMMAGAYFEVGNITPAAEFNVYVDPDAAHVVLTSGIPITMLPLDLTHQTRSTPARLARIASIGNRAGTVLAALLRFSEAFDLKKYGWDGAPIHSPNVPAWILKPELYESRLINVSVERQGELTLGMTVADWWGITDRPKNVRYVRNGDAEGLYDLIVETLALLP